MVCGLLAGGQAHADAVGFHYVPLRPSWDFLFESAAYREIEFKVLSVLLSDSTYGGSEDSSMIGLGSLVRLNWLRHRFAAVSPQFGLNLFLGVPNDFSNKERGRLSLQVPLAVHYVVQVYRDDRYDKPGANFAVYGGGLFPVTFDVTTGGFATSGDLGIQGGMSYAFPLGDHLLQANAALSKFFTGYYYVNDRGTDDLEEITGEPLDLGAGLHWLYLPWKFGLGADFHWTSSLNDIQGDTVYIMNLQFNYYPG